jgi:site-specific DNA recombinase
VRQSLDQTGQRLGVERQRKACAKKAEDLGWPIVGIYEDNSRSASTGKARPAYEQLLTDLEAGRVDAVVVWDLDRLHRRPIELEHFLDVADQFGVALASVGGDVDLATDNGRLFARIKGAVARSEVERKSARQKAANDQRAEAGRPPAGRRAYGYSPDGMTVVEAEAAEVRKAADEVLSGGTIRGVVADLTSRGVTTTTGGIWHSTELRRLLGNPRYAAQRVHRGEIVGPGSWPAIIELDKWRALQGVLADPARHRAGPPERYLLSGVAKCAACGGRIYGAREPRGRTYLCESRRHVVRRAEPVDDMVTSLVLRRLTEPDARELFSRPESHDRVRDMRKEAAELRVLLDGLASAFAEGDIDREQLRTGSARLKGRLNVLNEQLADAAITPVVADLLRSEDVEAAWRTLDLDRQREVIGTLMTVSLHSPGRGARSFDPATVEVTWKTD